MMISDMYHMAQGLTDLLFPPRCLACENTPGGDTPFCHECASRITFIGDALCPSCGIPFGTTGGERHLCGDCIVLSPPFSLARALGVYESILMSAIHRFKYGGKIAVGNALGDIMASREYDSLHITGYDLIIPVPLHPSKLRRRGFNQALILARRIAKKYRIPLDFTTLRRTKPTPAQVELSGDDRRKNVRGAFAVETKRAVEGRRVLLIDDVYTTGSTVKECARVLMRARASEVAVLTLART